ncbi:MAG: class I SAM-dependent methyltransferase [Anaerolineae bacterium]
MRSRRRPAPATAPPFWSAMARCSARAAQVLVAAEAVRATGAAIYAVAVGPGAAEAAAARSPARPSASSTPATARGVRRRVQGAGRLAAVPVGPGSRSGRVTDVRRSDPTPAPAALRRRRVTTLARLCARRPTPADDPPRPRPQVRLGRGLHDRPNRAYGAASGEGRRLAVRSRAPAAVAGHGDSVVQGAGRGGVRLPVDRTGRPECWTWAAAAALSARFTREMYPDADVVGVELDRPLLATAKAQVPGVRTVNGNVYHLPFADGSFDKILFTEVIEHIPDDRAALRELARVLAPGGRIAITTPNADYPLAWDPLNKILEATIGRPIRTGVLAGIWANHERLYTPEELSAKVAEAGLRVERTRCITRWAFPFIHNLVYGLGKELMVAGRLPASVASAADRFDTSSDAGGWTNPIRWGLAAFNAVDRLNRVFPPRPDAPFLIIGLCAVKPADER